jgi:hypothetical protein
MRHQHERAACPTAPQQSGVRRGGFQTRPPPRGRSSRRELQENCNPHEKACVSAPQLRSVGVSLPELRTAPALCFAKLASRRALRNLTPHPIPHNLRTVSHATTTQNFWAEWHGDQRLAARAGSREIGASPRRPRHQRNAPVRTSPTLTSCISETEPWNISVRPGSSRRNSIEPRSHP